MQLRNGSPPGKLGPVLIIDDDEIALQAIADLLHRGGYEVHALASPIGATQVIANQGISAAVIDLNMPVMRGDRFIALVRSWDRIRDLPVVLVSGESDQAIHEAALRLPGVAVVTKSQMNERLIPTLRTAMSSGPARADAAPVSVGHAPRPRQETPHGSVLRSVPRLARSALQAWQAFAVSGAPAAGPAVAALSALQAELRLLGLTNTAELLSLALQLVESHGSARALRGEAETSVSELLSQLATGTSERNRSFEGSLALTLLRTRLDRIRQMVP